MSQEQKSTTREGDRESKVRSWLFAGVAITCVVILGFAFWQRQNNPQQVNMRKADAHMAVLQPILAKDPEFSKVTLSVFTGEQGCLGVGGQLDSKEALAKLEKVIKDSQPPVVVISLLLSVGKDKEMAKLRVEPASQSK